MSTGHPKTLRLIADIGGTHTRIAMVHPPCTDLLAQWTFPTADYHDLATPLRLALTEWAGPEPDEALCAVASPLVDDQVSLTNVGWSFSITETKAELGISKLKLVNDWVAQALAIPHLRPEQCHAIHHGIPTPQAPRLVMGPGTGLGSAALIPWANEWQALACEGGHISFAPTTPREFALMAHIRDQYGHCSAERMASGIGITTVYTSLCALDGTPVISDNPEAISAAALNGNPQAQETYAMFNEALGSAAGDLALALGARGGVYIGGGLIPALGPLFEPERFYARFTAKGRFESYLANIPIWQMLPTDAALIGLATN
ncbi:MAG: glucokinase [Gammaproteobacteria bacterium]|nr:glucokinase [Gammaproteobacteria bacterium]